MKRILSLTILIIILLLCLTSCGKNQEKKETDNVVKTTSSTNTTNNVNKSENTSNTNTSSNNTTSELDSYDFAKAAETQFKTPAVGEQIAIMHVKDYGDILMKFFPDVAPKAVENFVTHAKNGYYNGLTFHRVINEFMIQGGDPLGNGTGGESIWGEGFGTELDYSLVPYRGSLCMAMSSLPNSIGSQFFITQAHYSKEMGDTLKAYGYPTSLLEQYEKNGGYLSLFMQYTVFGQVFQGMDVVDKIAGVKTDSNDKPETDVVIESIEITEYSNV